MADLDHNAEEVSDWIDSERRDFKGEVDEMLERTVDRTHEEARKEVPVDTGTLRDSLTKAQRSVFSTLGYAPHVGLGTIYQEGTNYLWPVGEKVLREEMKRLESS